MSQELNYQVINSDCMDAMRELIAQGVQVDSIVTDPPYELGFMGKDWDNTGIAYNRLMWKLCFDLLKPGGHLLAFGGSRTYHRMACAIEDAGFEIRDQIMWVYGQGFPKSQDISKAIDKMAGVEREVIGTRKAPGMAKLNVKHGAQNRSVYEFDEHSKEPATDAAKQWQGWGSALKPAHEPIVLARKPLSEKTIAANVLKHGTGGINIDGCRVQLQDSESKERKPSPCPGSWKNTSAMTGSINEDWKKGRFPANLIHDGSEEVEEEFAKYGEKISGHLKPVATKKQNEVFGEYKVANINEFLPSTGTASRFYYCAKASKKDRNGSKHPTVKPIALMRYLCKLITPPGGMILDPFAGSGTTGQAALEEGFKAILIEKEAEYITDINNRILKNV